MRKIIKSIFIITLLYAVVGFFLLPYYLQSNLSKLVYKNFGIETYVDSIHLNPFTYELSIKNFIIKDQKKENLLFFENLYLNLKLTDLLKGGIYLDHLKLDNFKFSVNLDKDKTPNFQFLIDQLSQKKQTQKPTPKEQTLLPSFTIKKLDLNYLNFTFADFSKEELYSVETKPFDINLKDISINPNHINNIDFQIDTKESGSIIFDSQFIVDPLELKGIVKLKNINFNKKFDYFKTDDLKFDMKSDSIDLAVEYSLNINESLLKLDLNNIDLSIPQIKISQDPYVLEVKNYKTQIKYIELNRDKELVYRIKEAKVDSEQIDFFDKTVDHTLPIKNFHLQLPLITSNLTNKIEFYSSLDLPEKGKLVSDGAVLLDPLSVSSNIKLESGTLIPYKKYIEQFTNIGINSFDIDFTSFVEVEFIEDATQYKLFSDLEFANIDLENKTNQQKLVKLDSLLIDDISLENNKLHIKHTVLEKPFIHFQLNQDGSINFSDLVKENSAKEQKEDKTKENTSKKTPPFALHVDQVEVKNGEMKFDDKSVLPHFSSHEEQINIKVKNITLDPNSKTLITHNSVIDKYALLELKTDLTLVNPLEDMNVEVDLKNVDLPSLSSYSGKFIGNKLANGKLSLALEHKIKKGILESSNNIKIQDLELGEEVESNQSIDAPIGLAIALLEDSSGLIDLDIPMDGDVKSPNFDLSDAISDVIVNTIVGIVTAPFKFLSIISGLDGDSDLSSIGFAYGESKVDVIQKEKLDTLSQSLLKRPNLELTITPVYDLEKDLKALEEKKFQVTYPLLYESAQEFDILYGYIQDAFIKLFQKEEYEKLEGEDKQKYSFMVQKLKELIVVEKQELESLGKNRALNLQSYLIEKGIEKSRIKITTEYQTDKIDTKLNQIIVSFDLSVKK
jgi:hypothetical protein